MMNEEKLFAPYLNTVAHLLGTLILMLPVTDRTTRTKAFDDHHATEFRGFQRWLQKS